MIEEQYLSHYKQWLDSFHTFKEIKLVMDGSPRPHDKIKRKNHYVEWVAGASVPYFEDKYKAYLARIQ